MRMTPKQRQLIADVARFTAAWREAPPEVLVFANELFDISSDDEDYSSNLFRTAREQYGKEVVERGFALFKLRHSLMIGLTDEMLRGAESGMVLLEIIAVKAQGGDPFAQWITDELQNKTSFVYALFNHKIEVPRERAMAARQH
jgi:hypothetical protein